MPFMLEMVRSKIQVDATQYDQDRKIKAIELVNHLKQEQSDIH